MSLIIALQFYEGDRAQAMRLACFIADLEDTFRGDVQLVFVNRADCAPADDVTLAYVGRKMTAYIFTAKSTWSGWPGGPNGMAQDFLQRYDGKIGDSVLLLEPDCVPMAADWIDQLKSEWMNAQHTYAWIMGAWRNSGGAHGHINGNCVVKADLARFVDLRMITPDLAWDCALAPLLKNHWYRTGLIKNCFQSRNATMADLTTPDEGTHVPVLVHGFKDDSAFNLAKERLLLA